MSERDRDRRMNKGSNNNNTPKHSNGGVFFIVILVILVIDVVVFVFVAVEQHFILQLMFAFGLAFLIKQLLCVLHCHLR